MGQGEDCAIGDALTQLSRLAEVIGNEDGLAVTRHQGMDSTKQNGGSDGGDNRVGVTARDIGKAACHTAIQPALNRDYVFH